MRHLTPLNEQSRAFIDAVIASKNLRKGESEILSRRDEAKRTGKTIPVETTYKERCTAIVANNSDEIDAYDTNFTADTLNLCAKGIPHPVGTNDKEEFKNLYSYQERNVRRLRETVLQSYCPICGARLVQDMDHYLPQEKYPLFVVHPKNLIPSCTTCNKHKMEGVFLASGERKYWNAYLDNLPTEQFLYCKVDVENGIPQVRFYVKQPDGMNNDLYERIKNTFEDCKLADTYYHAAIDKVMQLRSRFCNYYLKRQSASFDEVYSNFCDTIMYVENINEWEYQLEVALSATEVFKKWCKDELVKNYGVKVGEV